MSNKVYYSLDQFQQDVMELAGKIEFANRRMVGAHIAYSSIYGVPQGGIPVAMELSRQMNIPLVDKDPDGDCLIVDDIVDSGATRAKFDGKDFACLHVKPHTKAMPDFFVHETSDWIVYWWEGDETKSIEDAVIRMLEFIGEDPNREGLAETPKRVVRAWEEIYAGYNKDPKEIVKTFATDGYDQLVLIKDIEVYSMCEHHMLPFIGKAHVAYIPNGSLIGSSKLARLVEIYARRLQIQERLAHQVTEALVEMIKPVGAACIIEAEHLCMRMRGISKQNSIMITSSLVGRFLEDTDMGRAARAELMGLIK
jgi:GTP cyclohydrolase I